MELILIWFIFAVIVGVYASSKGKSGVLFTIISLFLSPLIGFLIALVSSPNEDGIVAKGQFKKCPKCKELIKKEAKICKHCGSQIVTLSEKLDKESRNSEPEQLISRIVLREFYNDTYYINFRDCYSSDFEEVKNKLLNQYKDLGYDNITIDNETHWLLKSSSYSRTYIQVVYKNYEIKVEAYNVQEEPKYYEEIKASINLENNDTRLDSTEKLIELSKLLEKGLLTEEEFNKQKALLLG